MSGYYNETDAPQRHRSHRAHRPATYEEEEVYHGRGPPPPRYGGDISRRYDYSSDSTEEIQRDFPPRGAYVKHKSTRRDNRSARPSSVGRDEYYANRSSRRDRDRRQHDSYSDSSPSRSPPRRKSRRQSLGEAALAALGVGGATAAAGKHRDRGRDHYGDRSRSRSRGRDSRYHRDYSSSRSRSRSADPSKRWQQAIKAAGTAAALEAWKSRKEPGGFAGKGKRIMTAAVSAAGVDKALDRDPDKHGKRHVLESAVGGLMGNRLINGRSQSRSRSRGRRNSSGPGLGGLASAAGLAAVAAKGLKNHRSKSRDRERDERGRGRRGSYSSSSSGASPPPKRSRSKSISRFINRGVEAGMARLGLSEPEKSSKHRRHYSDDDQYYYQSRPRGGGLSSRAREKAQQKYHGSSTDSYSSSEEERKHRKMRGKEYLTAGLATVATIHATHSVYQSYEKRKQRRKKLLEGEITPEQAKKQRNRARLQDAASVGIAALGIRGAVSEWKEMKELDHELKEHKNRWEEKRAHRQAKMIEAPKRQSEPDIRSRYLDSETRVGSVPPPPMGGPSR